MIVEDRVYGLREVSEPVALELMDSPALQRLKGVDQLGYSKAFFPKIRFNRFEHSVGVFLLLQDYGASLEEQIAGLLHDVSHTAFSHCMDFVVGQGADQSHQDSTMDSFIQKTEIPNIVERYGFRLNDILDDSRHPLKERTLPDLCADRIDYSLRTGVAFNELSRQDIDLVIWNLEAQDGDWVFSNYASAARFAEMFRYQNNNHYAGFTSAVMFRTVSDYLRLGIEKGHISMEDLYGTDEEVLSKLAPWNEADADQHRLWDRMNRKVKYQKSNRDTDAMITTKSRVVDPLCQYNGEILRVSDIQPGWKEVVAMESKPKIYHIKFES